MATLANLALTPNQIAALYSRYDTANDDGTINKQAVDPGGLSNATQLAKSYTEQFQGMDQQEVQSRLQDDPTYAWLTANNWLKPGDGGQPQLGDAYKSATADFQKQHPGALVGLPMASEGATYVGGTGGIDPTLGGYHEGGKWQAPKADWSEVIPYLAAAAMTAGAGSIVGGGGLVAGGAEGLGGGANLGSFNLFNAPGVAQGALGGDKFNPMALAGPAAGAAGFPSWLMPIINMARSGGNVSPIGAGMTLAGLLGKSGGQ